MEEIRQPVTNGMVASTSSSSINKSKNESLHNSNEDSSKKNESLESALRKFKKQSSGIISEIRKREAYEKPSVRRKKKSKEARKHKKMGKYGSNNW